jgi:hypothetical protein
MERIYENDSLAGITKVTSLTEFDGPQVTRLPKSRLLAPNRFLSTAV